MPTRLALLALAAAAPATAQGTIFSEVEPNDTKAEATPAFGARDGDNLHASTSQCVIPAHDFFHVRMAPLPPGIYEHRLEQWIGASDRTLHLAGLDASVGAVTPGTTTMLQSSDRNGSPHGLLKWYGFGKSEEFYVELRIELHCMNFLGATFRTQPAIVTDLGQLTPASGSPVGLETARISVRSVGGAADLELLLLDGEYNALPDASLDIAGAGQILVRDVDLLPGTYYLAVAEHELASHMPLTADPLETRTSATVLDFPGAVASGSFAAGTDVEVRVSNALGGAVLGGAYTKTEPYEVLWFRFTVGTTAASGTFCDPLATAVGCPSGAEPPVNSGMGCVNSTGRGGTLLAHAVGTSLGYTVEDLPANTTTVVFAGPNAAAPAQLLAGVTCLGPGVVRLATVQVDAAGRYTLPPSAPLPALAALSGTTLYAQAIYRDAVAPLTARINATSGAWVTLP